MSSFSCLPGPGLWDSQTQGEGSLGGRQGQPLILLSPRLWEIWVCASSVAKPSQTSLVMHTIWWQSLTLNKLKVSLLLPGSQGWRDAAGATETLTPCGGLAGLNTAADDGQAQALREQGLGRAGP